ncbi:hypothetical protein N7462_007993 [Penicillium macrosclerotiorum]|uniref:uncharacterized protein n=1 Tax=Penicillium macrosclerotiorum TaxID=303699 RepID=UPI002547A703|nr:uncharacterized protein N7462_007993 [Penicillium macrosclerotiorum]KAJ5679749.1 hypothetical protein N7462_007993 [Penicillium macrosclerotiorum]
MDSLAHDPGYNQLDTFLYLAVAQAITLGLNQENYSAKIQSQPTPYLRQDDLVHDQASARTLEEKRTFLGCYYLTMIYSVCLKDMQPLKFTDYADECCQTLCNASEFPNDTYGVHLVRTMHLAEKILRANSGQESKSTIIISAPVGLSLRGYQSEIKALKASFSCDFPQSATLDFHYNTLEILLYRVSLGNDLSDAQYGDYPVTLLDLLFRCLETTKLFFQNFYSLPSALFPLLPFTFYCQFGQAIVTLSRLSLYQTDKGDWDRDYVQQTLDLDHTVDRLTRKMEEVQLSASCTSGCSQQKTDELPEIYGKISRATKMIKEAHLSRKWAMEKAQIQTEQQVFSDFDFMSSVPIDSFFTIPDFGNLPDAFEGLI